MITRDEHAEQAALFRIVEMQLNVYPELANLYAVPNGGKREHRTKVRRDGRVVTWSPEGKKLKEEGVRAGVLDINLDVARRGFFGLRLEMKVGDNDLSAEQREWKKRLEAAGYCVKVCYSADAAWTALLWYLGGPPTRVAEIRLR